MPELGHPYLLYSDSRNASNTHSPFAAHNLGMPPLDPIFWLLHMVNSDKRNGPSPLGNCCIFDPGY